MKRLMRLAGCLLLFGAVSGHARLQPGIPFSDHMVIQAGRPIRVWGTGVAGDTVRVTLGHSAGTCTVGATGEWSLSLEPLGYQNDHQPLSLLIQSNDELVQINDVLVGEVWLCSGQSNMRFTLGRQAEPRDRDAPQLYPRTLAAATHSQLRLINLSGGTPAGRQWAVCSPETVAQFSAVGYHFGAAIKQSRNVPVGLIDLGKGGAAIRTFLAYDTFMAHPEFGRTYRPEKRPGFSIGAVYQQDLLALAPFSLRGVLWYQGEGDVSRAFLYGRMLSLMISDWRRALNDPGLPFLVVQLPPWERRRTDPERTTRGLKWAELREAQAQVSSDVPHTHLAVIADLGEPLDIHPRRKREVGERLALLARATVYGEAINAWGPELRSVRVLAGSVVLSFTHCEGGLLARGGELQHFAVGDQDGGFIPASAEITGYDQITVKIPPHAQGTHVRYAWQDDFDPTLFNGDGFPAAPFRTDSFPLTTSPGGPSLNTSTGVSHHPSPTSGSERLPLAPQ